MSPRTSIPRVIAAKVLFDSDRTCCVCRDKTRGVQLHHIDSDNTNHSPENLAVLCGLCHDETQLSGGFFRKLDPDQVILYREDWYRIVAKSRMRTGSIVGKESVAPENWGLIVATGLAEVFREEGSYFRLALHYNAVGNSSLRDKYVEKAIAEGIDDEGHILLRALQNRISEVLPEVLQRRQRALEGSHDFLGLARFYKRVGRDYEAGKAYAQGLAKLAESDGVFPLAFYLREVADSGIIEALFEQAFNEAAADGNLWWQIRALEELGWHSELRDLVLSHREMILEGDDAMLKQVLARATGDASAFVSAAAAEARAVDSILGRSKGDARSAAEPEPEGSLGNPGAED